MALPSVNAVGWSSSRSQDAGQQQHLPCPSQQGRGSCSHERGKTFPEAASGHSPRPHCPELVTYLSLSEPLARRRLFSTRLTTVHSQTHSLPKMGWSGSYLCAHT